MSRAARLAVLRSLTVRCLQADEQIFLTPLNRPPASPSFPPAGTAVQAIGAKQQAATKPTAAAAA